MRDRIYLDHAATTPLGLPAREAMLPWINSEFGNPSSLHAEGRLAKQAIDAARERFASALGCLFGEVTFTSSGTEAAQLALVGPALAHQGNRRRILVSASEHHAVLHQADLLARLGYQLQPVPVDQFGRIQIEALKAALGDDVFLVSVMHANNELGSFNPVSSISDLAHGVGALFHTDAVQTFPFRFRNGDSVNSIGADLLSWSAHKFYGPKGVGGLFVRAGTPMTGTLRGGGQERELRAGTENTAGIVGAAAALDSLLDEWPGSDSVANVRDSFLKAVLQSTPAVPTVTLPAELVLPGHAHLRLPGIGADVMLIRLDRVGLSASSGAACSSGSLEPSHVLQACGFSEEESKQGLRFTFGMHTTFEQAAQAAEMVADAYRAVTSSRLTQ